MQNINFAVKFVREGQRLAEHVNRFRNLNERPISPRTDAEKAIGQYKQIKMKAKALVDFYECSDELFNEEIYAKKFELNLESIPEYLKSFYYIVVFYNNFDDVMILNRMFKDPFRYSYNEN